MEKITNVFCFVLILTMQMKQQIFANKAVLMATLLMILQEHALYYVLKVCMVTMLQMSASELVPLVFIMVFHRQECVFKIARMEHLLMLTITDNAILNVLEILIHSQKIQLISAFTHA